VRVLAIDTETNAKDVRYDPDFRMLGVSTSFDMGRYMAVGHFGGPNLSKNEVVQSLQDLVSRATHIVFHNAGFDLQVIQRGLGLDLSDTNWYDTMLMQHMIDENFPNKSLDYMAKHYLGKSKVHDERMDHFINGLGWGFIPKWLIEPYAIQDAMLTEEIFEHIWPEFVRQGFVVV